MSLNCSVNQLIYLIVDNVNKNSDYMKCINVYDLQLLSETLQL